MEILFEHKFSKKPLVSVVLLDWSIRESCHALEYLNKQEVSRELYEIIWIEYYDMRQKEIESAIEKYPRLGRCPTLNKWIVMNMPNNIYYHKHLMYNLGIALSSGKVITFCDSDACVKPTFIKSIIDSFNQDENIVLHMDEVRNNNRKFYPFSYPSFEEIIGPGCINWLDDKPRGLVNLSDPIHIRNYGACMSALRRDLISIGGADEHMDYLGHICGPYEITFRLVNFGKREIWHKREWLYHTWHPGQAGRWNYSGPHDGKNMSTTALEVIRSGRIMPLAENPFIKALRLGRRVEISYKAIASRIMPETRILEKWRMDRTPGNIIKYLAWNILMTGRDWLVNKTWERPFLRRMCIFVIRPVYAVKKLITLLRLSLVLPGMMIRQVYSKVSIPSKARLRFIKKRGAVRRGFCSFCKLLLSVWNYDCHLIIRSRKCLDRLYARGTEEIIIFGSGDIARILYILTHPRYLKIRAFTDDSRRKAFFGFKLIPPEELNGSKEKIIIASLVNTNARIKRLKEIGVDEKRIVCL